MAVAVICEFNPFHNGHRFLLGKAKELTGEPVLAVMSGSFTQRGEVALCSKFERAEAALKSGADLVAELPAVYAVSCAERFARGGVNISKMFGCVNYLAFGCEDDDIDLLKTAAFAGENPEVNAIIAEQMNSGSYYPKAYEYAVRQVCGGEVADVLTKPNNILAVEYIRALRGTDIKPLPIKRVGAEHDSDGADGIYASASYIRKLLRSGKSAEKLLPYAPSEITYPEKLDRALLYKLRNMNAEQLRALPEVGEGLENRILSAARKFGTAEEVIDEVKTKRYTRSRICRILTCALLGITEELQTKTADYARVLGFTDEGGKMLKACIGKVITSAAKAENLGSDTAELLAADIRATDTAALAYEKVKPCGADYLTKIVKPNSAK
ncbi:MAG: nucleotidyltransferase family protein [Ruminococcus sp.]|nr:nucleotidyltransferase family protein [Ruminococcus sp.]